MKLPDSLIDLGCTLGESEDEQVIRIWQVSSYWKCAVVFRGQMYIHVGNSPEIALEYLAREILYDIDNDII